MGVFLLLFFFCFVQNANQNLQAYMKKKKRSAIEYKSHYKHDPEFRISCTVTRRELHHHFVAL